MTRQIPEFPLWTHGARWGGQEVAGEYHHRDAVRAALQHAERDDEGREWVRVRLVPEPDNPHDPNAISVRFGEESVLGYIPRDATPRWWAVAARVAESGMHASCWANIWRGDRATEVYLHLTDPEECLPLNEPPQDPSVLLPDGVTVQVVKEEEYFDVLADYVPPPGRGRLYLTLHRIERVTPRARKELVEVRLDGERVGELSATMSPRFLPILAHNTDRGFGTCVMATIEGSDVAARLTIQAVQGHRISPGDLNAPPAATPPLVEYSDDEVYNPPGAYVGENADVASRRSPAGAHRSSPESSTPPPRVAPTGASEPTRFEPEPQRESAAASSSRTETTFAGRPVGQPAYDPWAPTPLAMPPDRYAPPAAPAHGPVQGPARPKSRTTERIVVMVLILVFAFFLGGLLAAVSPAAGAITWLVGILVDILLALKYLVAKARE